jgi:hypothetical protein
MRSSKSRSRSKSNRPRSIGNIINRVFDSSGPEGKVRGTPQQIIEKYLILARDAQLSNDRVAAENFLQHAEHYTRLLGEAQRELAAEQEARQQQYQQNGQPQFRDRGNDAPRPDPREVREDRDAGIGDQPDLGDTVIFPGKEEESHLVETPEMAPREAQPRREGDARPPREPRDRRDFRGPRQQRENRPPRTEGEAQVQPARTEAAEQPAPAPVSEAPAAAAEVDAPAKPRRAAAPRKPRTDKPKVDPVDPKPEAAE